MQHLFAIDRLCIEYGVTIFIVFTKVGVSVAAMQVGFSEVNNCFSCKMQFTVSVIAM